MVDREQTGSMSSEVSAENRVFQLPKDTTPTWEMELLLSGALVFSMLQVPGLLDDILYSLRPRLKGDLNYGGFMLYFYLKVTSYALICTFVLHLASRAVWVAALGLRSVYPEGVLWDKLPRGPIYREYAARTTLTLDQMIDRADNRASLVFAFGLLLVLMSLAIMVFSMILVGVGALLGQFVLKGSNNSWITMGLVLLFVVPMVLATWVDRRFGARIPPQHWFAGLLRRIFGMGSIMLWGRLTNPILLTAFSRVGLMRGNLLMVGALYLLMAVILMETLVQSGTVSLPGERYLPKEAAGRELESVHYADVRDLREAQEGQPYIPGEIVRGPYLRLFVPYVPRRLDAVVERDCPEAIRHPEESDPEQKRAAEGARTIALLKCVADQLHPLQLDGQPVTDLRYDVARDPITGMRGFVAMIDVRQLPSGRHELAVIRPQRPDDDEPVPPILIPFWR
jgi:hypothetical protein